MKVLFMNNYPMEPALEEWRRGEFPAHHLWGVTHMPEHGIDVEILPFERYPILNKVGKRFGLGNYLDQEIRAIFKSSKCDLVYSACQYNTLLLSVLRNLGIFRKPIVAVIHHPMPNNKRNVSFVKGHDKLVCLSESVMGELEDELNVDEQKACVLDWGVDLPFYERGETASVLEPNNSFIVSAGKSARDHDTLAKAFFEIDYPLRIYCSAQSAPSIPDLPSNIAVYYNHPTFNAISYFELLAEYRKAYAVAVPLIDTNSLAGLTSLLDAMAVQKPVIMTKNCRVNVDIEKEGIGIWVDPGDVKGWRDAVTYLLAHPDVAQEMGTRGYNLCQSKYNLKLFSSRLADVFRNCLADA